MGPDKKAEYLSLAQAHLEEVGKNVAQNHHGLNQNIIESLIDQVPLDTHTALCSDPSRVRIIEQTIRFLEGCKPTNTIRSGSVLGFQSTLGGEQDQAGTLLYFEPTDEVPSIKPIPGIPNIISSRSRLGQRLLGQTAGTKIQVPSEIDGKPATWEIEICKIE